MLVFVGEAKPEILLKIPHRKLRTKNKLNPDKAVHMQRFSVLLYIERAIVEPHFDYNCTMSDSLNNESADKLQILLKLPMN